MAKGQKTLFEFADQKSEHQRFKRVAHGGGLGKNKRKLERPISTKRPMHITFHSKAAVGRWSFLHFRNRRLVESIIRRQARKFGVTVQDLANVGNHLHLKLKASSRVGLQNFLRTAPALIARKLTGARRGFRLARKFWDELAFSRVLKSYREELYLRGYFVANRQEGALGPLARQRYLNQFRNWVRETCATPSG